MSVCGCLFHSTDQREVPEWKNLFVSSGYGPDRSRAARIGLLVDAVLGVVIGA